MRYVLLLSLALAGCSAFGESGLAIYADPPAVVLDNDTGRTISYVVIEATEAAAADLAPVESWPTVASGRTARVPYDQIGYDEGDTEAVVFWSTGDDFNQTVIGL